jgi:iron complex transport system substrate-binding protein
MSGSELRPWIPALNRRVGLALLVGGLASGAAAVRLAPAQSLTPVQDVQYPRAISVGAGVTEIVYALGAQAQLLAVDTSSLYPPAARALPTVGYQRSLSAEGVLSLQPQVLLAGEEAGPPAVLAQLEGAGVRLAAVRGDYDLEGVLARVQTVAQALGRITEGQRLAQQLRGQWRGVQARMQALPLHGSAGRPLKVAFVMRHGPSTLVAGRGTSADALLRLVGVDNVFASTVQGFKPLAAEALVQAAPEAVVGAGSGQWLVQERQALLAMPGMALTPAGQQGRAVVLDLVLLLGFGPRLPQAVEALHQALSA